MKQENQPSPLADAVRASKAPAITRAAAVLRLLGKSPAPVPLKTVSRELGLVPSTALYVLRALEAEEMVTFDPDTRRWQLDAGVLTLARSWLRQNRFADLAQRELDALAAQFEVTGLGVRIVGLEHIIVVAVSRAGDGFRLQAEVGSRFPALISATGRCIAAFGGHAPELLARQFATLRWDSPPSMEQWLGQVADTRDRGFAVDNGHYISGVTVLAAPVGHGAPGHALVATGLAAAVTRNGVATTGAALLAAARRLTAELEARREPDRKPERISF